MSRYRFITAECGHYPVRRLCQVLDVPAILTTTITCVYTPVSVIKPRISLTNNFFKLLP